jgi:hypothetical protein
MRICPALTSIGASVRMTFSSMAADAVMTLNVDPGS